MIVCMVQERPPTVGYAIHVPSKVCALATMGAVNARAKRAPATCFNCLFVFFIVLSPFESVSSFSPSNATRPQKRDQKSFDGLRYTPHESQTVCVLWLRRKSLNCCSISPAAIAAHRTRGLC